jgi:hypothetical protein
VSQLLTRLTSWLLPERPERALREQLATAQKRLRESYDTLDSYLDPLERYRDGDNLYLPSRIGGQLQARKDGGSWPLLRTMQDLIDARTASRSVTDGNSYGAGFVDRMLDFVVGDGHKRSFKLKGVSTGATATGVVDADGDGRPDVDPAVEACQNYLDEFCELNDWGCGDEDREQEGLKRFLVDAEVGVRFFKGGADTNGVPQTRWFESEQLDEPPGYKPNERWGIRTRVYDNGKQDVETREAYYLKDLDGTGGEWVDAKKIVFSKTGTVRTVKRGYPLFALVAPALWQAEKLNKALAEVAVIQARIAYVRQHKPGTMPSQITDMIAAGADYSTTPKRSGRWSGDRVTQVQWSDDGAVVDMSDGMQFEAGPAATGTPHFILALQSRLRQVCARFGMPEFFTGDSSNNNYASILVSGGPFERSVKRWQKVYAGFQRAVFLKALEYGVGSGRLSEADVAAVELVVEPPGVSIANKKEEAEIQDMRIKNKTLSPQTAMLENGDDPALEMANIQAWQQMFAPPEMPGQDGKPDQPGQDTAAGGNADDDPPPAE